MKGLEPSSYPSWPLQEARARGGGRVRISNRTSWIQLRLDPREGLCKTLQEAGREGMNYLRAVPTSSAGIY